MDHQKILNNITELSKESLWSFLSNKIMDEGLGQIQYYNVAVDHSMLHLIDKNDKNKKIEEHQNDNKKNEEYNNTSDDENEGYITIRISGLFPDRGLSIPLMEYINEIGHDVFKKSIHDYLSNILLKNIDSKTVNTNINIVINKFNVEIHITLSFVDQVILEINKHVDSEGEILPKLSNTILSSRLP